MKEIKKLPSHVLYLYTYVDSKDFICKLYRSKNGKTLYMVYNSGKIYSIDDRSLKSFSNKIYDYVEKLKSSDVQTE